jgi:hypothetical protein
MLAALLAAGKGGLGFGEVFFQRHGKIKRMQLEPTIRLILKREGAGREACECAKGIA